MGDADPLSRNTAVVQAGSLLHPWPPCAKEKGYKRDTTAYCLFLKDGNGRQSLLLLKLVSSELAGEHAPTLAGRAGI